MTSIYDDTCPEEDGEELWRRLYDEQQQLRFKKREAEFQMEMNGKQREVDELKQQIVDLQARLDDRAAVQQLWNDPVRDDSSIDADDEPARQERASRRRYETSTTLTKPPTHTIPDNAETLLESAQQAIAHFTEVQGARGERSWTVKIDAMRDVEAGLTPLSTEPASFHLFDTTSKKLSHCIIWWKTPEKGWTTMRWTMLLATSTGYEQNLGLIDKNTHNMKGFLRQIDDRAKSM